MLTVTSRVFYKIVFIYMSTTRSRRYKFSYIRPSILEGLIGRLHYLRSQSSESFGKPVFRGVEYGSISVGRLKVSTDANALDGYPTN